jgi:hypothetical protein
MGGQVELAAVHQLRLLGVPVLALGQRHQRYRSIAKIYKYIVVQLTAA